MKKILLIFAVAALIASLGGCGLSGGAPGQNSKPAKENKSASETQTVAAEFSRGTVSGTSYKSEFAGFSAELPEGFVFYTDEQIAEINGITADALEGKTSDAFKKSLESGQAVTDMFAAGTDGLSTVNVTVENLEISGNKDITESAYAAAVKAQLKGSFESVGYSVNGIEKTEKNFIGSKHTAITAEWQYSGKNGYETLICKKVGKYMVSVTVCTWNENNTESLLACFKELKASAQAAA